MRRSPIVLSLIFFLALALPHVRAELFSLSASGTISFNTTTDTTIPVGTPWTIELVYDSAAPDLDFELTAVPDPTFGRYTNGGVIPALRFFHYQAGSYEVTLDEPADFGPFSVIFISFGGTHAIDINLNAPNLFPPLGGGPVNFHANFDDFTRSTLTSDGLPTDTSLGLPDFQGDGAVTLLTPQGVVLGSLPQMTSLTISAVPEPSASCLILAALTAFATHSRRRAGRGACPFRFSRDNNSLAVRV